MFSHKSKLELRGMRGNTGYWN